MARPAEAQMRLQCLVDNSVEPSSAFWGEHGKNRERVGEFIQRVGLGNFLDEIGASIVLRGMRAVSDFEYEFQLALMNRKLNRDVETVFLMTGMRWIFTSSSIIKEAAKFGGDISEMVPPNVERRIKIKFGF